MNLLTFLQVRNKLDIDKKCMVLLSGGVDSSTLAFLLRNQGYSIEALYFDYRQGQVNGERICALTIARKLDIAIHVIETRLPSDSLRNTIINQNPLVLESENRTFANVTCMYVMAMVLALTRGFDSISVGISADDVRARPSLGNSFVETVEKLASISTGHRINILTPFLQKDKSSILRIGSNIGVPYVNTWSCGVDVRKHCGECAECLARREAFKEAKLPDPTDYKC